jgi:hypothetical protein
MLIKPILAIHILAGLAAACLVGCANPSGAQDHGQHHAGQSENSMAPVSSDTSPAQGGMTGGAMKGSQAGCGSAGMQHMDKDSMCAMYRSMRDAPTEQARQMMMDRQMQGMSPEMRQHHMDMLRQQCQ